MMRLKFSDQKILVVLLFFLAFQGAGQNLLIAPVKINGQWGYIDSNGEFVISPQYLAAKEFDHNLGEVIYYEPEYDDYRTKFINAANEVAFVLPELNYSEFSEGFLAYKEADSYGYVDSKGNKVIPAQFKYCFPFRSGKAAVVFRSGKMGYINQSKQLVISPRYDTAYDFRDKFAVVGKREKDTGKMRYGVIDQYGNMLIPFVYDWITNFSENRAFANMGGRIENNLITGGDWAILDLEGERVIDLPDTSLTVEIDNNQQLPWLTFSNGVAWFPGWKDKTVVMGLIDKEGKWVVLPKYRVVNSVKEGLAGAFEGKMGFIDIQGKNVIPFKFDVVGDFQNGLAKVKIGDKFGYIDRKGNLVIEAKFEDAGDFVLYLQK